MSNSIDVVDKRACAGCAACAECCPTKCIKMLEDEDGFKYPSKDEQNCIGCGKCLSLCPVQVQNEDNRLNNIKMFALTIADEDLLMKSASGGHFLLFVMLS